MAESIATLYGLVEPVVRKYYGLEMRKETPQFSQIAEVDDVDGPIRDFVEVAGPGQLDLKVENAAMTTKRIVQGPVKRVQAATFAAGIGLSFEVVEDAKYKQVKSTAASLGRAARKTPEYLFAQFLDRSFDSNFPVTADNVELCNSTSHLLPDGTTFGNALSTPAALSESSYEDVLTNLRTIPGPDGMLSPEEPECLVTPSALHILGEKLTISEKTLGSANNDPSYVKGKADHVTFDYLTNNTRWFVKTKNPNGLYWDWRQRQKFLRDNVSLALQAVFIAFFRAMWGCEDPRGIYGSNAS